MLPLCSPTCNQGPRTPSSSSTYPPHTSSPLSEPCFSPSPSTSAVAKLQSRRIAQYKSTASTTTTLTRRVSSAYRSRPAAAAATPDESHFGVRLFSPSGGGGGGGVEVENPHSALLRDRLRQRCAHRAQQARTKRVERERRRNALSSDGEDLSMGSDEDDDDDQEEIMLNDELFRRIMNSVQHKQRHSYRLSFQNEVGSSLDPDMEDIAEWERTLQEDGPSPPDGPDLAPSEYDEEDIAKLAAEAEEDELWAELDGTPIICDKSQATPDEDFDMA